MVYAITQEQLTAFNPCDLEDRLSRWPEGATSLNAAQALEAGFSVSDVLWIAGRLGLGDKCAEFAIRLVRPLYDDSYWRAWADRWLSGEDRSADAAWAAADTAAWAAADAARAAAWAAYAAYAARGVAARAARAAAARAAAARALIVEVFA